MPASSHKDNSHSANVKALFIALKHCKLKQQLEGGPRKKVLLKFENIKGDE